MPKRKQQKKVPKKQPKEKQPKKQQKQKPKQKKQQPKKQQKKGLSKKQPKQKKVPKKQPKEKRKNKELEFVTYEDAEPLALKLIRLFMEGFLNQSEKEVLLLFIEGTMKRPADKEDLLDFLDKNPSIKKKLYQL